MALTLVTSDLIHGLDYSKLTGTITTWNQDTTGNADTATLAAGATILATARNIGGVSFNGSAAINLPGVNTAGNQNTSGVAATATLLETARTIGGVSFNGSTSINLPGVNIAGNQNTSGNAGTVTNGVYTVGNQTIGGVKTFSDVLTAQSLRTSTSNTGYNLISREGSGGVVLYVQGDTGGSLLDVRFGSTTAGGGTRAFQISGTGHSYFGGNVAIGISSPTLWNSGRALHIHNSSGNSAELHLTDNGSGSASGDGSVIHHNNADLYLQNHESGSVSVYVGGTNKAKFNNTGQSLILKSAGSTGSNYLQFQNSSGTNQGYIGFGSSGNNNLILSQESSSSSILIYNGGSPRMTILSGGNVGIGITSPDSKLDIISPSAAGSPYTSKAIQFAPSNHPTRTWSLNYDDGGSVGNGFNISSYGTRILYLNANGNVGIGTASPNSKLMVINTSDSRKQIEFSDHVTYRGSIGHNAGSGRNEYRTEAGGGTHAFFKGATSTTPEFFIDSGGKVGIGTASPSAKLDVHGTTGTRIRNTTSNQVNSIYETSRYYTAGGSTTTNVAIVTTTAFPTIGDGGYILVEVSASGYGGSGSNGLVFSWIGGGYGGHHHIPASYHPVEIIADTHHSSCNVSVYYPNYNNVGITIVNSSGTSIAGVMRVKVTTTY